MCDQITVSTTSAYDRHQLLRRAHDEALLSYDEEGSSDEVYVVTTVDGRRLRLVAEDVVPFCDGLAAGYAAARDAAELDHSLKVALGEVNDALGGHCKYCGAPLTSAEAVRCNVCARSQARPG